MQKWLLIKCQLLKKYLEMVDWYLGVQKIVLVFVSVRLKNNPASEAALSAVHSEVMAFG